MSFVNRQINELSILYKDILYLIEGKANEANGSIDANRSNLVANGFLTQFEAKALNELDHATVSQITQVLLQSLIPVKIGGKAGQSSGKILATESAADAVKAASWTQDLQAIQAEKSAIGATGKVGEDALKLLGGESQVFFKTTTGPRYVDQLVNGVANESKVGYTSLTTDVSRQIVKDVELVNTGQVNSVTWHFFTSPVTGKGGPSGPLFDALQKAGINVNIH